MIPRKLILAAILLPCLPLMAANAQAGSKRDHGVPIPTDATYRAIPVCYDFGCRSRRTISLTDAEWESVVGWFREPAATPEQERDQIRRAVGWMEVVVGRHTPTHLDLPADEVPGPERGPGQLDCIDESVNTTLYLRLFEAGGYLRHHVVIEEAYRRAVFDQHWSGQVREVASGTRYVVDSWFQPNGYLPIIQDSESWEEITMMSATVDNRPDEEGEEVRRSFWHRLLRGGN